MKQVLISAHSHPLCVTCLLIVPKSGAQRHMSAAQSRIEESGLLEPH